MNKNKYISAAITIAILVSGIPTAFAHSENSSYKNKNNRGESRQVASQQVRAVSLADQTKALQLAQEKLAQTQQSLNETLRIIGEMRQGTTSNQVALLQTLLAGNSGFYPEQIVTGFYGSKTASAVKRFQKKNGLSQTGIVDAATLNALNALLNNSPISRDDDDDISGEWGKFKFCINTPPGHERAKGWKKTHGNTYAFKFCKHANNGHNGNGHGTTTDTTAPSISGITLSGINANSGIISWTTNENAQSAISLATTSPVGTSSAVWSDGAFRTTHTATLTGLLNNSTYYFVIMAKDAASNTTYSTQGSFVTTASGDITAPTITGLHITGINTTSATVNWSTNELARGTIYTGTTSPIGTSSATWTGVDYRTTFATTLTGLAASTTYYYIIGSEDPAANKSFSGQASFTTLPLVDTAAPIISALSQSAIAQTTAVINWLTDENATSKVFYSTTTPVGTGTTLQVFNPSLVTTHNTSLSGLTASSTYYAIVVSSDILGNAATSTQIIFTTLP
jgi:peptidoglycan hydrolase-like protein with peptidoglycan-binding domain